MPTYAIGDLQGCFATLQKLLSKIQFNPEQDTLWFTGDLINRGPQSLETLRFVKDLGPKHHIVLGNHDLHFLAVAHGSHPGKEEDTLKEILTAPDKDELIHWLLQLPLVYYDKTMNYALVHAGIPPQWDLKTTLDNALEVENLLKSESAKDFLQHMYGNHPSLWNNHLTGWERLRCITNYLTRMRFCHADGSLDLRTKGGLLHHSPDLIPWFQMPGRLNADLKIIFGHWAALNGVTDTANIFALDTGCVWGYNLTAMRLEDETRFSVSCGS